MKLQTQPGSWDSGPDSDKLFDVRVLIVSSEASPLAKTGGLADAVSGLAQGLADLGTHVSLVLPAYQRILESNLQLRDGGMRLEVPVGQNLVRGQVLETHIKGELPVYLIRADAYYRRKGLYGTFAGDYPDNAERFIFFSRAALHLAERTGPWDVLHVNDWQSALVAVYHKVLANDYPQSQRSKVLLTIHNLAYQGSFPQPVWKLLNIPQKYNTSQFLEYYGNINFLKGGILFADGISTVSKKYAAEIRTSEHGCGLDGVLKERQDNLVGILNGADYDEWSPENDPYIAQRYSSRDMRGKKVCKEDLQRICHLPTKPTVPLVGMVTRLAEQKGIDIVLDVLDELSTFDLQLVLLGSGEQQYHQALASVQLPSDNIRVKIGFNNTLAHKIEAGADLFLMPSRYEPCGLNQIYSLKYGTIPIVRATGGLDDTIEDFDPDKGSGNGFKFSEYSGRALLATVRRAITMFRAQTLWQKLMTTAMAGDFSWQRSADQYLKLYKSIVENPSKKSS